MNQTHIQNPSLQAMIPLVIHSTPMTWPPLCQQSHACGIQIRKKEKTAEYVTLKRTCIMSCHNGCPCHSSDLRKTQSKSSSSKCRCRKWAYSITKLLLSRTGVQSPVSIVSRPGPVTNDRQTKNNYLYGTVVLKVRLSCSHTTLTVPSTLHLGIHDNQEWEVGTESWQRARLLQNRRGGQLPGASRT